MCRFVAYLGKRPTQLKTILTEWPNSLISQSRLARESRTLLNGDGFGLGWYNHDIDEEPDSLYYAPSLIKEAIIVASEKLTESENDFKEIPPNHVLLIDENLVFSLKALHL